MGSEHHSDAGSHDDHASVGGQGSEHGSIAFSDAGSHDNHHDNHHVDNASVGQGSGHKFIAIGIDFGTTYCGVSWAFSEIPNEIHEIAEWPSANHLSQGETQVPSAYDLKTGKWGYQITPDMDPIKWFKLLLLNSDDIQQKMACDSTHVKHASLLLSQASPAITAKDVVGRYLHELWKHTYSQIEQRLDIDSFPVRVAITVPAIWPPYALSAMREAAALAGIVNNRDIGTTTLDLVQEPEAAGLSTLFQQGRLQGVENGDSFVVCDAGGGTVDVISYLVTSTSPFCLEECVQGEGSLTGAIRLDDAFEDYLRVKTHLRLKNLDEAEYNNFFIREWEHGVKRIFNGASHPPHFVLTPPLKAIRRQKSSQTVSRNKEKKDYIISRGRMITFFEHSLTGILSLVGAQVEGVVNATSKEPKRIVLVGGLGSSPYIYDVLQKLYPKRVLRPSHPWSAVARGAVIRVLQDKLAPLPNLSASQRAMVSQIPDVMVRKSRYSYGTPYICRIDELPDFDQQLDVVETNEADGKDRAHRIDWYLKKGDDVFKAEPVEKTYFLDALPSQKAGTIWDCAILYCASDIPPKRPGPEVLKLCTIKCEVGKPFEQWDKVGTEGWRRFSNLSLAVRFDGQLKWTAKAGADAVEREIDPDYTPW